MRKIISYVFILSLFSVLIAPVSTYAGKIPDDEFNIAFEVEVTVFDNKRNPIADVPVYIYEQKYVPTADGGTELAVDAKGNRIFEKSTEPAISNGDGRTRDLFAHTYHPFYIFAEGPDGTTYGGQYDFYYDRPNVWVSYDAKEIVNLETDLERLAYLHIFPEEMSSSAPEVPSTGSVDEMSVTLCGDFPDVPENSVSPETCDALNFVRQRGIFTGNAKGEFEPNRPINRAEVAKVMLKTFGIATLSNFTAVKTFPDVKTSAWYHPYVMTARSEGIVGGYPDGNFKPEAVINRVELLRMFEEGAGSDYRAQPNDHSYFNDVAVDAKTSWYIQYANFAFANSYLDNNGMLYPANPMDRIDVARLIFRALGEV